MTDSRAPRTTVSTTVIWRLTDHKPGHDQQSAGLIAALSSLRPITVHSIAVPGAGTLLLDLARKRFTTGAALPTPQLIIGAGHGTHQGLIAARRARGGRAVVLMKPDLPLSWFDLCVIPRHDKIATSANVLITDGVLNTVRPTHGHAPHEGLILIGGPSKHHSWDRSELITQVQEILQASPKIRWSISDSRRTPVTTRNALQELDNERCHFISHQDTNSAWVAQAASKAGQIWVSEDSISMIFEALTSGAAVGLIKIPVKRAGRVTAEISRLAAAHRVSTHRAWQQRGNTLPPPTPLFEAQRVAAFIDARWPLKSMTHARSCHITR